VQTNYALATDHYEAVNGGSLNKLKP